MKISDQFPRDKLDFCKYSPKVTYSNNWNCPINSLYFVVNANPYNFNYAFSSVIGFRVNGERREY